MNDGTLGMGQTLYDFRIGLRDNNIFGARLRTEVVPYSSEGVEIAAISPNRFLNSVRGGIDLLKAQLRAFEVECGASGSGVILAGYSQGASVIHQALVELDAEGEQVLLGRIMSVDLFANPQRVGADRNRDAGGGARRNTLGIGVGLISTRNTIPLLPLEQAFTDLQVVRSWCIKGDMVCEFRPSRNPFVSGRRFASTSSLHRSYDDNGYASRAGREAGNLLEAYLSNCARC